MVLFPIALIWLRFIVLWAVRQTVEPSDAPASVAPTQAGRAERPHGPSLARRHEAANFVRSSSAGDVG